MWTNMSLRKKGGQLLRVAPSVVVQGEINRVSKTRCGSSFVGSRESVNSFRLGPNLSKPSWFCAGAFVLKSCIRFSVSGFLMAAAIFYLPQREKELVPALGGSFFTDSLTAQARRHLLSSSCFADHQLRPHERTSPRDFILTVVHQLRRRRPLTACG